MDERDVEMFLTERLASTVTGLTTLPAGAWSRAYAFRTGGRELVVRFGSTDEDYTKDRAATRYASSELPVPRVLEIGAAFGGSFALSEKISGDSLDELSHAEMRAALPSLLATLDAIRRADISDTAGFGVWDATGAAPFRSWKAFLLDVANGPGPTSRIAGWRERLASSRTGSGPFQAAYERLHGLARNLPDERYLCHADLLNGNVLVSGDHLVGVLDWGNSMYGDFLYDLAWFCFWAPWYPQWHGINFAEEATRHYASIGLRVPAFHDRLQACQLHIGLDGQAYNAFKERWDDVDAIAQRTLRIAETT